jgi:hypothetical protein
MAMEMNVEDELLLKRYLLGSLTEAEQARIEERLMLDREYLQQAGLIEEELTDRFLNNLLSEEEREQFLTNILSNPERQQDVIFTDDFNTYVARRDSRPLWKRVLVFTGFLSQESSGDPNSLSDIFSLVLIPGVTRSASATSSVNIPPASRELHLDLMLEDEEIHNYHVELRNAQGETLIQRDNLQARKVNTKQVLAMSLPIESLTAGEYQLVLSRARATGDDEKLAAYFFKVREVE